MVRQARRELRWIRARRTIVTGASSNHAASLVNLVRSIRLAGIRVRIIAWDLGLTPEQVTLVSALRGVTLRTFPYEAHPEHLRIEREAGSYAWKPVIISEVARERPGLVLWLDAGDLVFGDLEWTWQAIAREGIYSPVSAGVVSDWTHAATKAALGASPELDDQRNRNGAIVGFDVRQPAIGRLLEHWRSAALDVSVIAPPGSSRDNHRQDQAVLTILYYQAQQELGFRSVDAFGDIAVHQDHVKALRRTIRSLRATAAERRAERVTRRGHRDP